MLEADITHDGLAGIRLLQPRLGHRAGMDAVILADAAAPRAGDTVMDFGSASGAVGLMIAMAHPAIRLVCVERDPDLIGLCRRNIALNKLESRATAIAVDLFWPRAQRRAHDLVDGTADLVVTNPPFFAQGSRRASPDPARRAAHDMTGGTLDDWLDAAALALKPKGRVVLINRADQLQLCLDALRARFGSLRIMSVQPKRDADAVRVVVTAVKGGRGPLTIAPALILTEPKAEGRPQAPFAYQ